MSSRNICLVVLVLLGGAAMVAFLPSDSTVRPPRSATLSQLASTPEPTAIPPPPRTAAPTFGTQSNPATASATTRPSAVRREAPTTTRPVAVFDGPRAAGPSGTPSGKAAVNRTRALWSAGTVGEVARRVATLPAPRIRYCLKYRTRSGYSNQLVSHQYAMMIALMVGATYVELPRGITRRHGNFFYFGMKFRDIPLSDLFDLERAFEAYTQMGIAASDHVKCDVSANATIINFGRNSWHFSDFEQLAAYKTRKLPDGSSVTIDATHHSFIAGEMWGALVAELKPWPNELYRMATGVWHPFRGWREHIRSVSGLVEGQYGVFHLRAEHDNLWYNADQQMEFFEALADGKRYTPQTNRSAMRPEYDEDRKVNAWYVASGIYSKSYRTRPETRDAVESAKGKLSRRGVMSSASLPDNVRDFAEDKKSAVDWGIASLAKTYVGVSGSTFAFTVAEYRDTVLGNPRSYLLGFNTQATYASLLFGQHNMSDGFYRRNMEGMTRVDLNITDMTAEEQATYDEGVRPEVVEYLKKEEKSGSSTGGRKKGQGKGSGKK